MKKINLYFFFADVGTVGWKTSKYTCFQQKVEVYQERTFLVDHVQQP
jgi:hypothetical protein